jgi:ribonuclease R
MYRFPWVPLGTKTGQIVVSSQSHQPLSGQLDAGPEVLGEIDDLGMEQIAARKWRALHIRDNRAMLVSALPDAVRPGDKQHRVDLTDISPGHHRRREGCARSDDAVYCAEVAHEKTHKDTDNFRHGT